MQITIPYEHWEDLSMASTPDMVRSFLHARITFDFGPGSTTPFVYLYALAVTVEDDGDEEVLHALDPELDYQLQKVLEFLDYPPQVVWMAGKQYVLWAEPQSA